MPTPPEVPLVPAPPPAGVAAPVSRAVDEDLQAIFPDAAARPNAARPKLGLAQGGRRLRRPQSRAAALGALAAAALAGVSAGALLDREPEREAPSQRSAGGQLKLVMAPATDPPRAQAGAERVALIAAPASSLPSPGPLSAPVLVRTVTEAPPPSASQPLVKAKAVRAPSRVRRQSERAPVDQTDTSPLGRCGADCGHEDVMEADARLRRAYARAVDAGAPRSVITGYRKEWASLRNRAPDHPRLVVWRYSAMANDLERYSGGSKSARRHYASDDTRAGERYADDAQPSDTRRKRPGPLKALRAELASLWP